MQSITYAAIIYGIAVVIAMFVAVLISGLFRMLKSFTEKNN